MLPDTRRRYAVILALVTGFCLVFNLLEDDSLARRTEEEQQQEQAPIPISVIPTSNNVETVQEKRPVMHTFYDPSGKGYCCGMLEDGHQRLLRAWEDSWQDKGWDTVILTKEDAMRHPLFESLAERLKSMHLTEYNQKCFWRWLAMAAICGDGDGDIGGGWMSDYDTMPLELTAEIGNKLATENGGKFTSYSWHVPCLLYGSRDEWDRVINLMIGVLPPENTSDPSATDMMTFLKVRNEVENEGDVVFHHSVVTSFPYKNKFGSNNEPEEEDAPREFDCENCQGKLIIHFSHHSVKDALANKQYPKDIRDKWGVMNGRGEAARVILDDYKSQCESNPTYEGLKLEMT